MELNYVFYVKKRKLNRELNISTRSTHRRFPNPRALETLLLGLGTTGRMPPGSAFPPGFAPDFYAQHLMSLGNQVSWESLKRGHKGHSRCFLKQTHLSGLLSAGSLKVIASWGHGTSELDSPTRISQFFLILEKILRSRWLCQPPNFTLDHRNWQRVSILPRPGKAAQ